MAATYIRWCKISFKCNNFPNSMTNTKRYYEHHISTNIDTEISEKQN